MGMIRRNILARRTVENTAPVGIFTEEVINTQTEKETPITRTNLARMRADEVKEVAEKYGIDVSEKSANDLRKEIIEKLRL